MCDIKGMVDCIHETKMKELVGGALSPAREAHTSRHLPVILPADTSLGTDTARDSARCPTNSPGRDAASSGAGDDAVSSALRLSAHGNSVSFMDLSSQQKGDSEMPQEERGDVRRRGERGIRIGEIVEVGVGRREEGEEGEGEGKEEAVCQERLKQPYQLQTVAHSLGGAACLIYVVTQRWKKQPQRMTRLICLSPAGTRWDLGQRV